MIYFLALIPATVLTIAGYFVLFLSARSEGENEDEDGEEACGAEKEGCAP